MSTPEFWISIGSTYSYLTVSRLPEIERSTGFEFEWRPFSVREIMVEMDNIPFAKKPVKAAYMWRDIERRAKMYGLKPLLPAPYPLQEFDLANRIAVVAREEGWCRDYIAETYRRWFEEGDAAGGKTNLSATLEHLGKDLTRTLEKANSTQTEAAYKAATQAARDRGIFGAPSFCIDTELFWGDDRLEDALAWLDGSAVIPSR
ncbi:2-hydroxychromene-2-carboxylate isomerase [Hoeflea halophila]|uniref:2-hydroxychromene-2-carboxylate isomerase n=1 Tax=Hoeflea halophila TaxID=714899 RepID=A0A286I1W0_9HYPH|nr:DsbA family protein [Hoeflea halophila]SOE14041.1 2-hydroxychromene-2-carboxylate isomerase [Hoeflea halophila]